MIETFTHGQIARLTCQRRKNHQPEFHLSQNPFLINFTSTLPSDLIFTFREKVNLKTKMDFSFSRPDELFQLFISLFRWKVFSIFNRACARISNVRNLYSMPQAETVNEEDSYQIIINGFFTTVAKKAQKFHMLILFCFFNMSIQNINNLDIKVEVHKRCSQSFLVL